MKQIATALLVTLLAACARDMDARTYSSSDTVGKVVHGRIVHVEAVKIKDQDDSSKLGVGALGGAAAGGATGATVGGGSGKTVAAVGGAIAGAVIGSLIEEGLSTQSGYQYVVQLKAPTPDKDSSEWRSSRKEIKRGNASVEDDVKESIHVKPSESEVISVIQTDETPLVVGQEVLVIYHDDRPRIVPAAY